MTKSELKLLKKKLPRGFGEKLHERTGIPTSYIFQLLGGRGPVPMKLLDAVLALAEEKERKEEALKKFISKN